MKQLKLFEPNLPDDTPEKIDEKSINFYFQPLGKPSPVMGYEKYIQSEEWKAKATFARQKRNYTCQRCGKKNCIIEVHHKNYDCLYEEYLNDVEVLCEKCHLIADEEREYNTAFRTWADNKYGDIWYSFSIEMQDSMDEEFDEWWYGDRIKEEF